MYSILVKSISLEPSCIKSWFDKWGILFTQEKWEYVFNLPYTLTQDTKLLELQAKIIHRTYATDSFVSNFDKSVCPDCQYCNTKNDISHWFVTCVKVKSFWKLFINWYNKSMQKKYTCDMMQILFGYCEPDSLCINDCLLLAKMYKHKTYKKFHGTQSHYFSLVVYLQTVESQLHVLRNLAVRKNNVQLHESKFITLDNSL